MTIISVIIIFLVAINVIARHIGSNSPVTKPVKAKELNADEQIEYHYSNIYNSLILFANSVDYLKSLDAPAFDPIFELESEFDIGFSDYSLNTNLENQKITQFQFDNLVKFKNKVYNIEPEFWNYESLETNNVWKEIRSDADKLLNELGITRRTYNFDFTTIYYVDK